LKSGKRIVSEAVLVSAGRQGNTDKLNLGVLDIEPDKYGRLTVNEHYQTKATHVYAVGDVIGFPALASTGMRQGRCAACHACTSEDQSEEVPLPDGINTIPEVGLVGETEDTLTARQIPYETGVARYKEMARGSSLGDELGMMKILFHRETQQLL